MGRSGKKRLLFILEILILLFFIGGLYLYGQLTSRLEHIEQPVIQEEEIAVNPEVKESELTGYTTYALFGIDKRLKNVELSGENSDTIIVASINNDTGEVKLVSVYRDTVLDVGGGNYSKANSAYAAGGPERAISMLNTNLDLDITDYVTVDFNALATVVDLLGGLDVPLSYAEIVHMNNFCIEVSKETGKAYTPVELPPEEPQTPEGLEEIIGTYHLNGVQVTSYCRIRYTANLDMGRTERQRRVISMLVDKAKTAGLTTIFNIMDEVFTMVQTSLNQTEILKLIPAVIGYRLGSTTGFPFDYSMTDIYPGGTKISIIAPTSLTSNVSRLHEFLYGKTDYTPSAQVQSNSTRIAEMVSEGGQNFAITETPEESAEYTYQEPEDYGGGDYDYGGYDDGDYDDYGDYDGGYGGDDYGDSSYDDGSSGDDYDYGGYDGGDDYGDGGYDDGGSDYGDGGYNDGSYYGDNGYEDGGDYEEGNFGDGGEEM